MNIAEQHKLNHEKIDQGASNFKSISDNVKNKKFEHLDSWVYYISKTFVNENTSNKVNVFPRYNYGTIIKLDFGINIGSELSSPHFAIVLDKYDNCRKNSLTILPLTSQESIHNVNLNNLIENELVKRICNRQIISLKQRFKIEFNYANFKKEIAEQIKEFEIIHNMIKYYSKYSKISYACINQITTISKERILKPQNKFDIISHSKCDKNIMTSISQAIIKRFTNIRI